MAFAGLGGGLWLGLGEARNASVRRENAHLLEINQENKTSQQALNAELLALREQSKLWPDLATEALARAFQTSRVEAWLEVASDGTIQKSLVRSSLESLAPRLARAPAGTLENPAQPRQPYLLLRHRRSAELETVLVLSPQRRFSLFQAPLASGRRHVLLDMRGRVLAHSQKELVGADLSGSDLGLRIRREASGRAQLKTLEGIESAVAWSPIDDAPVLLASERVLDLPVAFPWAQFFGKGLLILGVLSFLGLIFSRFATAHNTPLSETDFPTAKPMLAPALESLYTSQAAIAAHRERTQTLRPIAATAKPPAPPPLKPRVIPVQKNTPTARRLTAADLVARFEHQSRTLFEQTADLRLVQSLLCETSAQLCASPVLYFRFEPQSRTLSLETDAGFSGGSAPAAAVFPLSLAALESISAHAAQGARISLAEYAPLQKLLLDRMGVACFEAWGFMAGTRLLGVLVILQTNSQTELHREHVFRMMGTILRLGSTPKPVRLPQAAFHAVSSSAHV